MVFHRADDGSAAPPTIDQLVNHAVGIEQQLIELNAVHTRPGPAGVESEFRALVDDLADTADRIARADGR